MKSCHHQDSGGGDMRRNVTDNGFDPNWNPMEESYNDKNFNSYTSGPGRDLPLTKQALHAGGGAASQSHDGVKLYVTGIPNEMTEVGLKNIFSQAGRVLEAKKMRSQNGSTDDTFGFVTMSSTADAELAIQKIHNFSIKNDKFKLHVKMALTPEAREQRKQKQLEEEEFVKNLPSSQAENGEHNRKVEVNEPFATQPGLGRLNKVHQAIHADVTEVTGHHNPQSLSRTSSITSLVSDITKTPQDSQRNTPTKIYNKCSVCGNVASKKCPVCKMPYCGRICQEKDWSTHKLTCDKPRPKPTSVNPKTPESLESRFEIDVDDEFINKVVDDLINSKGSEAILSKEVKGQPHNTVPDPCKTDQTSKPQIEGGQGQAKRLMYAAAQKCQLQSKSLVVVSLFESPSDFWVTELTIQPSLDLLLQTMGKFYSTTTNLGSTAFCPEVGQMCAAQFSVDRGWYRARVNRILLNANIHVTYIDYGNSEEISVTATRSLETRFMNLPLQAVHCRLHDIEPVDADWTIEARKCAAILMNDAHPHEIIVHGSDASKPFVDFLTVEGMNVVDVLVTEGHAKRVTKLSQGATLQVNSTFAPHKEQTVPQSQPLVAPSQLPDIPSQNAMPAVPAATTHNSHLIGRLGIPPPPMPTVAQYIKCDEILSLQVLEVSSPGEFWAQLIDDQKASELKQLREDMNIHYKKLPVNTGFTPLVKKLYACRFSVDGEWYRAQVINFDTTSAHVIYLDHGNRERVPFSSLHSLESAHCSMPFQALRCCLNGAVGTGPGSTWTPEAVLFFCQQVTHPIIAQVLAKDDTFCEVLVKTADKSMLIDKMINAGLAVFRDGQMGDITTGSGGTISMTSGGTTTGSAAVSGNTAAGGGGSNTAAPPRHMAADLPHVNPPTCQVCVTVVIAPAVLNFVVQNLSEENKANLLSVLSAMGTFQQQSKSYTPIVGELITAKFIEDNAWYRAEVMRIMSHDQFMVKFIDYGNLAPVNSSSIAEFSPAMMKYPALGIPCRLANVLDSSDVTWDPAMLENQGFIMSVVSCDQGVLEVELFNKETKQSIGNQLVELGYATKCQKNIRTVISMKDLEIPRYQPGIVLEQVLVTDASSPLRFTVQCMSTCGPILQQLDLLLANLHKDYIGVYVPTKHELVTTRYLEDGLWYRASVNEVHDKKVEMTLVDYGNRQEVDASQVNKLDTILVDFPVLGIQCALAGVGGSDKWDASYLSPMQALFTMKIVDVRNDLHYVELIDSSGEGCINKDLLLQGFVLPDKPLSVRQPLNTDDDGPPVPPAKQQNPTLLPVSVRMVTQSVPMVNQSVPVVTQYVPVVTQSVPMVTQSVPVVNQSVPMVTQSVPMVNQSVPMVNQSVPVVTQSVLVVTQSVPMVSQSEPMVSQPVPMVSHPVPMVSQRLPMVSQPMPMVTQPVPILLYVKSTDVPIQTVSGPDCLGVTTHFLSPAEFNIMYIEDNLSAEMEKHQLMLEQMYTGSRDVHAATVGELVACYCDTDKIWYRGEVTAVHGDRVNILYVDFGNEELLSADNIRRLDPALTKLPQQAIKCRFDEDLVFTKMGAEMIGKKLRDQAIGFLFGPMVSNCLTVKDAISPLTQRSLIEDLIQQGLVARTLAVPNVTPQSVTNTAPPRVETPDGVFTVDSLETQHLPDSNVKVMIMHANSPSDFVLNVAEEWAQNELLLVMKPLNEYCLNNPQPYVPTFVNQVVCAQYQSVWYRASVIEILRNNKFKLEFFDYGNTEIVDGGDIRQIQKAFLDLRRQGVHCCLQGIVGTDSTGQWSQAEKQWFTATFLEQDLALKPTNQKQGEVHVIDLIMKGGTVSQFMLDENKACRSEIITPSRSEPQNQVRAPTTGTQPAQPSPPASQPTVPQPTTPYSFSDLPQVELPVDMDVGVVVVQNPGHFHCQDASKEDQQRIIEISTELRKHYLSKKADTSLRLNVGELCVAFSKQYNELFRAVVLGEPSSNGVYNIQYIDFGDIAVVEAGNLHKMIPDMMRYGAQAIHCTLDGVSAIGPTWQMAATEAFKAMTINGGMLRMKIISQQDTSRHVTLAKDNLDLGTELVNKGLAIPNNSFRESQEKQPKVPASGTLQSENVRHPTIDIVQLEQVAPPLIDLDQPGQMMPPLIDLAQPEQVVPPVDLAQENLQLKKELDRMKQQIAEMTKIVTMLVPSAVKGGSAD